MLSEEIKLIELLGEIEIEVGVLDKDSQHLIRVYRADAEGNKETSAMKAEDAAYFEELGTFDSPGRFLFERISFFAGRLAERWLDSVSEEILEGGKDRSWLEYRMRQLALNIRDSARNIIRSQGEKEHYIATKTGAVSQEAPFSCDLADLAERVDCVVKFTN